MKKTIIIIFTLLTLLTGCSAPKEEITRSEVSNSQVDKIDEDAIQIVDTKQDDKKVHIVPVDFSDGYDPYKYEEIMAISQNEKEPFISILIEGKINDVYTSGENENKEVLSILIDNNNNKWYLDVDKTLYTSENAIDELVGHQVLVTGVYNHTNTDDAPIIYATKLFDKENGLIKEFFYNNYYYFATKAESINVPEYIVVSLNKSNVPEVTILPEETTVKKYSITTDDDSVVRIENEVELVGVKEGETKVSICTLGLNPVEVPVYVFGDNSSLVEIITEDKYTRKQVGSFSINNELLTSKWESSNPEILKIDEDGNYEAVGFGDVEIISHYLDDYKISKRITVEPVNVEKLTINEPEKKIARMDKYNFSVSYYPDDSDNVAIKWSVKDENIGKIDDNGLFTATAVGDTVLTATIGDVIANYKLSVIKPDLKTITISMPTTVNEGGQIAATASFNPSDARNTEVAWSSSDKSIAAVDSKGNVKGIKTGEAVISATCGEVVTKKKIKVVKPQLEKIELWIYDTSHSNNVWSITEGQSKNTYIKYFPDNAERSEVKYSSDDTSVATVDASGKITAIKPGTATITATCSNKTDYVKLNIKEKVVYVAPVVTSSAGTRSPGESSGGGSVYVTPTGKKYHRTSTCGGKNSYLSTKDEALNRGLDACSKCW